MEAGTLSGIFWERSQLIKKQSLLYGIIGYLLSNQLNFRNTFEHSYYHKLLKAIRTFLCVKILTISNTMLPLRFDLGMIVNACVRYFYKNTFLVICATAIVCCPSSSSSAEANLENTLWSGINDAGPPGWNLFL